MCPAATAKQLWNSRSRSGVPSSAPATTACGRARTPWSGSGDEDTVATASDIRAQPHMKPGRRGVSRVQAVPETLFYPRGSDGVHLQPCREGFELQHWRKNVLIAALWFPQRPDTSQVERFLGRQEIDDETSPEDLEKTAARRPGPPVAQAMGNPVRLSRMAGSQ